MIIDNKKNIGKYTGISERMNKAFKYLSDTDLFTIKPGKYEIDGDNIYMMIQEYNSKPLSEGKWEAHKKYIDIQYMISGTERMGYAFADKLKTDKEYDDKGDFMLFTGSGDMLVCPPGTFMIFFPDDAHMPCIQKRKSSAVKKAVIKVKV